MRESLRSVPKPPARSECLVVAFPLLRRIDKVRQVARQVAAKRSDRHEGYYRDQIGEALERQLERLGIRPDERNRQMTKFWQAVEVEVARCNRRGTPGGSAA